MVSRVSVGFFWIILKKPKLVMSHMVFSSPKRMASQVVDPLFEKVT